MPSAQNEISELQPLEIPSPFAVDLDTAAALGAKASGVEIVTLKKPAELAGVPDEIPVALTRGEYPHVEGLDDDLTAEIPSPRGHADDLPPDLPPEAHDHDPAPGRVVRRKVHTADPMTVDDALSRMELVGHDFYLFADAESGEPSVVYRRKGYDYGVIQLTR